MKRLAVLGVLLAAAASIAWLGFVSLAAAQEEEEERSRFVRFVERQISTPNRQIRLGRIEGALSSDVTISSITISDREGEWLRIENAELVWSRLALLRGRLDVDQLSADRIEVVRPPLPAETEEEAEPLEDAPFEVPDLPVAVELENLSVPEVSIAEGVIGPAVRLGVDGRFVLAGGALDADLAIERLDRPGTLSLDASFSNETRQLALDLVLSEPEDGVVANALDIEGRPPIRFEIDGSGPLDDFAADIVLEAAGETLLSGATTLSRTDEGLRFRADVSGDLGRLVPETYAELVAEGSRLVVDGVRQDDGAIVISEADLSSGALQVDFSARIAPDGVPVALDLDARLGREDGAPVDLPGGAGEATINTGRIEATLGGPIGERWNLSVLLDAVRSPAFSADRITLSGGGEAQDLSDPDARSVTFDVTGAAAGLSSERPAVDAALGDTARLEARGSWTAGQPVDVAAAEVEGAGIDARFEGEASAARIAGTFALAVADLAAFAGLADRNLAGSLDVTASGTVDPADALFDLDVDGTAQDLAVGIPAVDGLLAGTTRLTGSAARLPAGFLFSDFRLDNDQLDVLVDGQTTEAEVDLSLEAALAELSVVSGEVSGAVDLTASLTGEKERPDISARLSGEEVVLSGTPLRNFRATVDGTLADGTFDGRFEVDGELGDSPLAASGAVVAGGDVPWRVSDLTARVGGADLSGNLAATGEGTFEGDLSANVPDLSTLAPLLLTEASGSLAADIALQAVDGRQDAGIEATARNVSVAGVSVGEADVDLALRNVLEIPSGEGTARLADVSVAGFTARSARLEATGSGEDATRFDLEADLARAQLTAGGVLDPLDGGFSLVLSALSLVGNDLALFLREETAEIVVREGAVEIDGLTLSVGGGSVAVSGTLADTIDLSADVDALPLSIANLVYPPLELGGTVSGTLEASGTREAPEATFDLSGEAITAAPLREAGLGDLALTARGGLFGDTLTLAEARTTIGGGTVTASGTVGERLDLSADVEGLPLALANAFLPDLELSGDLDGTLRATGSLDDPEATFALSAPAISAAPLARAGIGPAALTAEGGFADGTIRLGPLRLDVGGGAATVTGTAGERLDIVADLSDLPLAIANGFAPDLDLSGTLGGRATASGSLARPQATFTLSAPSVSAAPLAAAGIGAVSIAADGSFANGTVRLARLDVSGNGLSARASGTVPLSGPGLSVEARAEAPLALAEPFLARRGATVAGAVVADVRVTGRLSDPVFTGTIAADGIRFIDPGTGLDLTGGTVRARLDGEVLEFTQIAANLGGGTISGGGTIRLDPAAGLPADIAIDLSSARYVSDIVAVTLSGDIAVTGALLRQPLVAGDILIERAEITVPNRLPGGPSLLEVAQIGAPPDVLATLRRAEVGPFAPQAAEDAGGGTGGARLDITIRAPNRIFVRGRGIDAELGGQLTITGTTADIVPVGQFDLIRGRIEILTERITFTRGSVTLVGDFDPFLDFLAETTSNRITVRIAVTGPASNPTIELSSVPDLPQDEILAQLLFGRSVTDLSPAQLAELAASAAALAGGGGPTPLEQIRRLTGLDDLGITTQEGGGVALEAGRYVSDNIYLGVEAGEADANVSVNLDITRNLTARATAGTEESTFGFFFEREY